jgi:hypothetical protein
MQWKINISLVRSSRLIRLSRCRSRRVSWQNSVRDVVHDSVHDSFMTLDTYPVRLWTLITRQRYTMGVCRLEYAL